jgi:hypothetical protein
MVRGDHLATPVEPELLEDMRQMRLHRRLADAVMRRELLVRHARRQGLHDLVLARAQSLGHVGTAAAVPQPRFDNDVARRPHTLRMHDGDGRDHHGNRVALADDAPGAGRERVNRDGIVGHHQENHVRPVIRLALQALLEGILSSGVNQQHVRRIRGPAALRIVIDNCDRGLNAKELVQAFAKEVVVADNSNSDREHVTPCWGGQYRKELPGLNQLIFLSRQGKSGMSRFLKLRRVAR